MREVRIRVHQHMGMIHVMSRQSDHMHLETFRIAEESRYAIETAVTWALEHLEHVEHVDASMQKAKH